MRVVEITGDHQGHCCTEQVPPEPVAQGCVQHVFKCVQYGGSTISLVNILELLLAFKLEDVFYHMAVALRTAESAMSVCSSMFFLFVLPCKGTVTR